MTYQTQYLRSLQHPEDFWRDQAQQIAWFREPTQILTRDDEGLFRWFPDGRLNTAYLALDWHVENGRADQAAVIYDSPVTDTQAVYTYRQLTDAVARLAGALHQQGVAKGDTVILYMPMIPQTIIGMLACARIGAIHSVVFGGFAPRELAIRIDDAQPKVVLTASAGKEIDRVIDYPQIVRQAIAEASHRPNSVLVYQRPFYRVELQAGSERDWDDVCATATPADCVVLEATDPLYILYTSGTTGRPKGVVRDHGGHAVAMKYSMTQIYDARPGEVYWAASDVGWVVGHSYIVYGPLIQGCPTVLYEGKPVRTPDAGAFWRVAAEHDVRVMFTAPTAIRAIKREDPEGRLIKLGKRRLRYLFLAGERCDVATLNWIQELLEVPVIDHWWQTESGWPMLANPAGTELLPIRPGSAGKPVCGYDIRVLDSAGQEVAVNQEGTLAVRLPLPPGCLPNLWHNTARFRAAYLETYPGFYLSGDAGYRDAEGYVFVTGRTDDVINVAGHRLSTATLEEVLAAHPAVAECAVVGVADALKGQVPLGFVVLKADVQIERADLQRELARMVRDEVGHIASLKQVVVTLRLPKTRSGKILRRIIRSMAEGETYQVPSTIDEPVALEELAEVLRNERVGANRPPRSG